MSDERTPVLVLHDARMQEHDPGAWHPERPDRLRAIDLALFDEPLPGIVGAAPSPATREAIAAVHDRAYVDSILRRAGETAQLDPDTAMSPGSVDAALLAAGAGVDAVDAVMDGRADSALALVRPPGHHAERGHAMGFCLFNNIAVAAHHGRQRGAERVLVVDWDVHHGNGTQHTFDQRRDVLFFSTHRYPFFPGTGAAQEIGRGAGEGYTINVPLPTGRTDGDLLHAFEALLLPVADAYRPDLVLVSAGFDAHRRDPLGGMAISEEGFAALCDVVRSIAGGRVVLLLEGGYDLVGLARSVRACAQVLAGAAPPEPTSPTRVGEEAVERVRRIHRRLWTCLG